MNDTIDVLQAARRLIEIEGTWCRGFEVLDDQDRVVKRCAVHAIREASWRIVGEEARARCEAWDRHRGELLDRGGLSPRGIDERVGPRPPEAMVQDGLEHEAVRWLVPVATREAEPCWHLYSVGGGLVGRWNDQHEHAEVLAGFDEAIAAAEAREAQASPPERELVPA